MKYNHENLEVYKISINFVKQLYIVTEKFPKKEIYGLTSQIRRSAISVPLNIVEGCHRYSYKDFARFIRIAIGSLMDTKTCIVIALELSYLTKVELELLDQKIEKLYFKLVGLHKWLKLQ